jgi:hypothetical protein
VQGLGVEEPDQPGSEHRHLVADHRFASSYFTAFCLLASALV